MKKERERTQEQGTTVVILKLISFVVNIIKFFVLDGDFFGKLNSRERERERESKRGIY